MNTGISAPVDTSYEPFALEPEYIELNRAFVRSLGLRTAGTVVDVACGTATLSTLLLDELPPETARVRLIGIDLLRVSLEIAQRFLAEHPRASIASECFLEGPAEQLPLRDGVADVALLGNAIHCFDDKAALLAEMRRVLRRGGMFAFNSSFYAGTFPPGTERFYTEWLKTALGVLREMDAESRRAGGAPIVRVRGRGSVAFSRPWLSADEYAGALETAGFALRSIHERALPMTRRNFETVGAFDGLARVLLSGYPVAAAAEALVRSAGLAMSALGLSAVPRNWLEIVAVRR
jgi:SAM-dependent methyltransferase